MKKITKKKVLIAIAFIIWVTLTLLSNIDKYPVEDWLRTVGISEDSINSYTTRFVPFVVGLGGLSVTASIVGMIVTMARARITEKTEMITVAEMNNALSLEASKLTLKQNNILEEQGKLQIDLLVLLLNRKGLVDTSITDNILSRIEQVKNQGIRVSTIIADLNKVIASTASLQMRYSDKVGALQDHIKYANEQIKKYANDADMRLSFEKMRDTAQKTLDAISKLLEFDKNDR